MEFQTAPFKLHIKYLTYTLKDTTQNFFLNTERGQVIDIHCHIALKWMITIMAALHGWRFESYQFSIQGLQWWLFHFSIKIYPTFPVSIMPESCHYNDVIMGVMASQLTSLTIVYSTFYSRADHRKHQSSASLAFAWGIHWWPVNSLHKRPVTWKMFPFDDVIMSKLDDHWSRYWFVIYSMPSDYMNKT